MSFDARSRERLEALGRQLPKPLPTPEPTRSQPRADAPRHAVETEQDPEQLFRELMAASADGSVPPHLMDRLRELEASRRRQGRPPLQPTPTGAPGAAGRVAGSGNTPNRSPRNPGTRSLQTKISRPRSAEEEALYVAFQQLLLEGDEDI
ncbi:MAG: hypothetical protein WAM11_07500 [Cyanobium sp.]